MFKIITDFPIALESNDHINPVGTKNDNNSNIDFIFELEGFFNKKLKVIDLGCAGGKFISDLILLGHNSIGLDGSDFSIINKRAEWPYLLNKNLFTCDVSKPFVIHYNNSLFRADVITAWEVLEHISINDLPILFENIRMHLKKSGIFVGSINQLPQEVNGFQMHVSVFNKEYWYNNIFKNFKMYEYPFRNHIRNDFGSFRFMLKI